MCSFTNLHFKMFTSVQRNLSQELECSPLFKLTSEHASCYNNLTFLVSACPLVPQSGRKAVQFPGRWKQPGETGDGLVLPYQCPLCALGQRGLRSCFVPFLSSSWKSDFSLCVYWAGAGAGRDSLSACWGWVIFPPLSSNAKNMGSWKREAK